MAGTGDLWEHLADEVKAMRGDVRRMEGHVVRLQVDMRKAYDRMGRVGSILGKVAAATRKRFEDQEAQLRADEERFRQLERRLAD